MRPSPGISYFGVDANHNGVLEQNEWNNHGREAFTRGFTVKGQDGTLVIDDAMANSAAEVVDGRFTVRAALKECERGLFRKYILPFKDHPWRATARTIGPIVGALAITAAAPAVATVVLPVLAGASLVYDACGLGEGICALGTAIADHDGDAAESAFAQIVPEAIATAAHGYTFSVRLGAAVKK